jgi:hypothetical protein
MILKSNEQVHYNDVMHHCSAYYKTRSSDDKDDVNCRTCIKLMNMRFDAQYYTVDHLGSIFSTLFNEKDLMFFCKSVCDCPKSQVEKFLTKSNRKCFYKGDFIIFRHKKKR